MWAAWGEDSLPSRRAWSTPGGSATSLAVSNSLIPLPRDLPGGPGHPVGCRALSASPPHPRGVHPPGGQGLARSAQALPPGEGPHQGGGEGGLEHLGVEGRDHLLQQPHRLFQTLEHRYGVSA